MRYFNCGYGKDSQQDQSGFGKKYHTTSHLSLVFGFQEKAHDHPLPSLVPFQDDFDKLIRLLNKAFPCLSKSV
ncbi:MAG: hypothetical protein Kow0063_38300 [Anaerolineae bacterium]